ncbi:MAG: hypothetical protein M1833_001515 [Piccolia ochrophora]|nr:MAG: hypothetical protein M1833_001515 [Piccolia ochrophora]
MPSELWSPRSLEGLFSQSERQNVPRGHGKSNSQHNILDQRPTPIAVAIKRGDVRISSPMLVATDDQESAIINNNHPLKITTKATHAEPARSAGGSGIEAAFVDPRQSPVLPYLRHNSFGARAGRAINFSRRSSPVRDAKSNSPRRLGSRGSDGTALSAGPLKKKGSTLKSAFRRLLSRATPKRGPSDLNRTRRPSQRVDRCSHHRSDPMIFASMGARPADLSHARSASLPTSKAPRAAPQRHPKVVPEKPCNSRHAVLIDAEVLLGDHHRRSRRATVPSILISPMDVSPRASWTGLTPRPMSGHVSGSKSLSQDLGAGTIGIAVTGDDKTHRRSRSASALGGRESTLSHLPGPDRHMTDELRYWRSSFWLNLSPKSPGGISVNVDDTDRAQQLDVSMSCQNEDVNLEARVARLESKVSDVEQKMTAGRSSTRGPAFILQDAPKRRPHHDRSLSPSTRPTTTRTSTFSHVHPLYSIKPGTPRRTALHMFHPSCSPTSVYLPSRMSPSTPSTSYASPEQSPAFRFSSSSFQHHLCFPAPPLKSRSLSASTAVRAASASHSPLPQSSPVVDVPMLLTLVKHEQRARKRLEDRMGMLQAELEGLKKTPRPSTIEEPLATPESLITPTKVDDEMQGSIGGDADSAGLERTLSLSQWTARGRGAGGAYRI